MTLIGKVWNEDCMATMSKMKDNSVDLVLTDPPYGINADKGVGGFGSSKTDKHYDDNWDSSAPPQKVFSETLRISKNVIIFGGQFFTDKLPPNGHWIVWDKKGNIQFDNPFGDCELAWTNIDKKSVKKYTVIQQGFISKEKQRYHPTQKPVELFSMILQDYSQENDLIYDPFLGSGTTAVACINLKRCWIGSEISSKYCSIANERIKAAENQLTLF
jgi:site-specific DNA-methyltransferase (adenine-specific)